MKKVENAALRAVDGGISPWNLRFVCEDLGRKDGFCIGFLEKSRYGKADNFKGVIGITNLESYKDSFVGRLTGNPYTLTYYTGVVGYQYQKDDVSSPRLTVSFNTVDLLLPFFALAG